MVKKTKIWLFIKQWTATYDSTKIVQYIIYLIWEMSLFLLLNVNMHKNVNHLFFSAAVVSVHMYLWDPLRKLSHEFHTVTGNSCPFMSITNYKSVGGPVYPVFVQRLQIYSLDHTLILQCLKYNTRDDTWFTLTTLIYIENRKACTFIKWIITQTSHHLNAKSNIISSLLGKKSF